MVHIDLRVRAPVDLHSAVVDLAARGLSGRWWNWGVCVVSKKLAVVLSAREEAGAVEVEMDWDGVLNLLLLFIPLHHHHHHHLFPL